MNIKEIQNILTIAFDSEAKAYDKSLNYFQMLLKTSVLIHYKKHQADDEAKELMQEINSLSSTVIPTDETELLTLNEELKLQLATELEFLESLARENSKQLENPFHLIEEFENIKKGYNPQLIRLISAAKAVFEHFKDLHEIIVKDIGFFCENEVRCVLRTVVKLNETFNSLSNLLANECESADLSDFDEAYQQYCLVMIRKHPNLVKKSNKSEYPPMIELSLGKKFMESYFELVQNNLKSSIKTYSEIIEKNLNENELRETKHEEMSYLLGSFVKSVDGLSSAYQNTDFFSDGRVFLKQLRKFNKLAKVLTHSESDLSTDTEEMNCIFNKGTVVFDGVLYEQLHKVHQLNIALLNETND